MIGQIYELDLYVNFNSYTGLQLSSKEKGNNQNR